MTEAVGLIFFKKKKAIWSACYFDLSCFVCRFGVLTGGALLGSSKRNLKSLGHKSINGILS